MKHKAFGQSDPGKVRAYNEDHFLMDAKLGLYIVADGMGGPPAGELACSTTCQVIHSLLQHNATLIAAADAHDGKPDTGAIVDLITTAIQTACRQTYSILQNQTQGRGGCTVALLLLCGKFAIIAHVGDCRVYLVREGGAHQVTEDHVKLINQPGQGKTRRILTRTIGLQDEVVVESLMLEVMPQDLFLLCTDGIAINFKDEELADCCRKVTLGEVPSALIAAANQRDGRDNATLVAARVESVRLTEVDPARQIEILRAVPLFARLDYREMVKLCDIIRFRKYTNEQTIIADGDTGSDLYILLKGKARVSKLGQKLAELPAGAFFGEGNLIEQDARAADVISVGETTAMVIRRIDLLSILDQDPIMCTKVLWSMCQMLNRRLRKTSGELSWVKSTL